MDNFTVIQENYLTISHFMGIFRLMQQALVHNMSEFVKNCSSMMYLIV